MASWPLEYSLQVRGVLYLECSAIVERGIVYGSDHLACGLISQGQEVREVVFAERGIVLLQPLDAFVLLCRGFVYQGGEVSERLDAFAVFLPFGITLLQFA